MWWKSLLLLIAGVLYVQAKMQFFLSEGERSYLKTVWGLYVNQHRAAGDINNATISVFQEKPEVAALVHHAFGVKIEKKAVKQLALTILKTINDFFQVILDNKKSMAFVRSFASKFQNKKVPIESILLYPSGLIVSKIAKSTMNPNSANVFTKLSFGVSAMLCGAPSKGIFQLTKRENVLIQNAWARYSHDPQKVVMLVASTFFTMPKLGELVPELRYMKFDEKLEFSKQSVFRKFVYNTVKSVTKFLKGLHNPVASEKYLMSIAHLVNSKGLPLASFFFGTGIVMLGQMKETIAQNLDPETERAYLKAIYGTYPLVLKVQKFGAIDENGNRTPL